MVPFTHLHPALSLALPSVTAICEVKPIRCEALDRDYQVSEELLELLYALSYSADSIVEVVRMPATA